MQPQLSLIVRGTDCHYHHEHWDGTGYPEGLNGEAIPLLGRLPAVAVFFDAVTSARADRPAIAPEDALVMMQKEAGRHFDPQVIEALLRLHARGELLPAGSDTAPSRDEAVLASPGEGGA